MTPMDVAAILKRLDQQDEVLGEIKVQARLTNGRVTALEREQIKREEREKILREFAQGVEDRQVRREDGFRWRVGQTIALFATAGGIAAVVAQIHF